MEETATTVRDPKITSVTRNVPSRRNPLVRSGTSESQLSSEVHPEAMLYFSKGPLKRKYHPPRVEMSSTQWNKLHNARLPHHLTQKSNGEHKKWNTIPLTPIVDPHSPTTKDRFPQWHSPNGNTRNTHEWDKHNSTISSTFFP